MPTWDPRANALFLKALEMPSAAERQEYLDGACAGDAALRAEVEALLEASAQAGSFLESPAAAPLATVDEPVSERLGTVIGPYKLLQQLGEGGMGTVFLAEQTQPVQRKVALKIIKPGMDSRQVIARFEAERQALALMDHPNIARVLDAGTTATGRPYFVMELVKGVPITKYCDEQRLSPKRRLELFVSVCQAVQHAHQKGIIHRDLKPSNVLIAVYDGKPVPKVIDFGVAKATGPKLTDRTLFTEVGQVVGTLEYMSPEQAELNQFDIDTRSDIYSLGVLLYELLTGSTPLERKRLKAAAILEVLRLIREEEPPRPSTRLSTTDEMPSVAANRGLEPKKLSGVVRGELDWIVMKALEKDRNRRYETANGFAMDVHRYLADEPVLACPPSLGYRFRKFRRRHKGKLAVAGLLLFFLVLLGGGAGWVAWDRAVRHRLAATEVARALEEARAFCRDDRLVEARAAAQRAEGFLAGAPGPEELRQQVQQVQTDVQMATRLEQIRLERAAVKEGNSFDSKGADLSYQGAFRGYDLDVLALAPEQAAERLGVSLIKDQLLAALYDWYLAKSSADLPLPDRDRDRKRLLDVLGLVDLDSWRSQFRAAMWAGNTKALKDLAQNPRVLEQPPATSVLLAQALAENPKRRDHRELLSQAIAVLRSAQQQHPSDFWINHNLALCSPDSTPVEASEKVGYYRVAVALRPKSPGVHLNLGNALQAKGDLAGASAAYRKAADLKPDYATAYSNLGSVLRLRRDLAGAVAAYRKALSQAPEPDTAYHVYHGLGHALDDQGDQEGAIAAYREAAKRKPDEALIHDHIGHLLQARGDEAGAITALQKASDLWRKQGNLDDAIAARRKVIALAPEDAAGHSDLAALLWGKGDEAGALDEYRKVVALRPKDVQAHLILGAALRRKGDWDGALAADRKATELEPHNATAWDNLGLALQAKGDQDGAIGAARKALALDPKVFHAHSILASLLGLKGDPDGAVAAARKGLEVQPKSPWYHGALGDALKTKGDTEGAIAAYRKALEIYPQYLGAAWNLANLLRGKGDLDGAGDVLRQVVKLDPKNARAHAALGEVLRGKQDLAGAIASAQKAVDLDPKNALSHIVLAQALDAKEDRAGALAALQKAIEVDPKNAGAHAVLSIVLRHSGDFAGAVAAAQKAIALNPKNQWAYGSLGDALQARGDLDGAIAAYGKAIELDSRFCGAYRNLGKALKAKGDFAGAGAAYRKVIVLEPNRAGDKLELGEALQQQGQFRQALKELRRGHELAAKDAKLRSVLAQAVKRCERLIELAERLPSFLDGTAAPAGAAAAIELAELCALKRLHRAALRFYEEAFAAEPRLVRGHRDNAARAAARAGCGQNKDADKIDGKERTRLRRQALDWLRADLDVWGRLLESEPDKARPLVVQKLQHWLADTDFAGVRGPAALARLPEAERQPWQELWSDVADTLTRAQRKTMPKQK
jgi:tetratricopeptide (TPR) repeat protein/serine/threonine protein kinase